MLKERVISGLIIALIGLTGILCGGFPLWCLVLIIVCLCMFELFRAAGIQNSKATWIMYPLAVLWMLFCRKFILPAVIIAAVTIVFMSIYVFAYPSIRLSKGFLIPLSFFYIAVLGSCIYLLRAEDDGIYNAIIYIIGCFGTDIFAYFVGSKFGKHHPFPLLSPKKSVEGCIGGVLCAVILGCIVTLIMKRPVGKAALMLFVVSVFSEIGDLAASGIKRQFGIKDYGNVIPGHGGMLDRFDSSLFAGGIVLICVTLL